MSQTTVEEFMTKGIPGQLADLSDKEVRTFINNQKQQFTATVTAADLETTITVNGVAITANAGGGVATKTVIRDELLTNLAAAGLPVVGAASGTDALTVRSNTPDVAITVVGTTNATVVEDIANGAAVGFGLMVVRDSNPGADPESEALLPNAVNQVDDATRALGITIHSHANEQALVNANNEGYSARSAMSVLVKGYIYVEVEDAVVAGQPAFFRHAASGANTTLGKARSDNDGGTADGGKIYRFETSAAAGGIAVVRINGANNL